MILVNARMIDMAREMRMYMYDDRVTGMARRLVWSRLTKSVKGGAVPEYVAR